MDVMEELDDKKKTDSITPDENNKPSTLDLQEFHVDSSDTKYFVCNWCKNWNTIKPDEIKSLKGNVSGNGKGKNFRRRKTVHMEIDRDLALIFKKFCTNFDGYEGGIIALLNSFQIKQEFQNK